MADVTGQALTVDNNAPNDGFSELLNASFGATTGGVIGTGSITGLAPEGSDISNMVVSIDTSTAGDKSGTATMSLVSDGTGLNTLGQTPLPDQVVNVTGAVYRLADPSEHTPEPVALAKLEELRAGRAAERKSVARSPGA